MLEFKLSNRYDKQKQREKQKAGKNEKNTGEKKKQKSLKQKNTVSQRNIKFQQDVNKQLDQEKASFKDVVNKIKRLFDDKIKFVVDQLNSDRHDGSDNRNIRHLGNQLALPSKSSKKKRVKVATESTKVNGSKQGFSELISNLQHKINLQHKLKQKQDEMQKKKEKYDLKLEKGTKKYVETQKIRIKSKKQKFKQKQGQKSAQKYGNTSRTLSGNKNIEKVLEKGEALKAKEKKEVKEALGKKSNIQANYQSQVNLHSKQKIVTNRINSSIGKYKSRLKTTETNQTQKFEKKLQKKQKIKKLNKEKEKQKQKITRLKKTNNKSKSRQKSKEKYYSKQIIAPSQRIKGCMSIKDPVRKLHALLEKKQPKQSSYTLLTKNKQLRNVSSSSDVPSEQSLFEEQGQSSSSLLYQQITSRIEGSDSNNSSIALGSMIMYEIGVEGQLKFRQESGQVSSDKSLQEEEEQGQEQFFKKQTNLFVRQQHIKCLNKYIVGLKESTEYKKLLELRGILREESQFESKVLPGSNSKQSKQSLLKVEQALREEQKKWLNFKNSLERIKQCPNISQQLQKIIQKAEQNHLALKFMQITDLGYHERIEEGKKQEQEDSYLKNKMVSLQKQATEGDTFAHGWKSRRQKKKKRQIVFDSYLQDQQLLINDLQNSEREQKKDKKENIQVKSKADEIKQKIQGKQLKIHEIPEQKSIEQQNKIMENLIETNQFRKAKDRAIYFEQKNEGYPQQHNKNSQSASIVYFQASLQNFYSQQQKHNLDIPSENLKTKLQNNKTQKRQQFTEGLQKQVSKAKKKLSYEQAPLQIRKILHKPSQNYIQKQKQVSRKKEVDKLISSELDLSQFMMNQGLESKDASQKATSKRMKILEQLRSPKSISSRGFRQERLKNSESIDKSNEENVQWKQTKNRIKISLFSKQINNKNGKEVKTHRSDNNLELEFQNRTEKQQSKQIIFIDRNKNMNIRKQKNFSMSSNTLFEPEKQLSSRGLSFGLQIGLRRDIDQNSFRLQTKKQENKDAEISFKEQQDKEQWDFSKIGENDQKNEKTDRLILQENQLIIFDDNAARNKMNAYFFNEEKEDIQYTSPINEINQQFFNMKNSEEKPKQQKQNVFRKSTPVVSSNVLYYSNQIHQILFEILLTQFFNQLFISGKPIAEFSKAGKKVIQYLNSINISVTSQNSSSTPERQKKIKEESSPFSKIKTFQQNDELPILKMQKYYDIPDNLFSDEGLPKTQEEAVRSDSDFILLLTSELFNFIFLDSQRYKQFMNKIQKPLGVSTLRLLKILRYNEDQIENSEQLEEYFQQNNSGNQESDQYYIISLETLINFEAQMPLAEAGTYQRFFNESIYDKINIALDSLRPFGSKGLPVVNFVHLNNSQPHKQLSFDQIKYQTMSKISECLKIKLGLFHVDIDSDRAIQWSFEKMMKNYALQLDDQWSTFSQGQFDVKYQLMSSIQNELLNEEVNEMMKVLVRIF